MRAVLLGWSSIEIVLLGWGSTVAGRSNHSRVLTAVVVHCGSSTLQQHRPWFLRKKKKKKKQTQRVQHMPQFDEYSSSSTTTVVHMPRIE